MKFYHIFSSDLVGCPLYILNKLQKVQNSAAKLVFNLKHIGGRDHVQPLFQALHCLPVQARIDYRLSTLCHNFFLWLTPFLPLWSFHCVHPFQTASFFYRHTDTSHPPDDKTKIFGQLPFSYSSYCATKQWNSLPSDILHIQNCINSKLSSTNNTNYHNNWFQIMSSLLPSALSFPHLHMYTCQLSVCLHVCCVQEIYNYMI